MPSENARRQKGKRSFTVVLIPGDESRKTKTFSVGKSKVIGLVVLTVVLLTSSVVAVLVFTPIGTILPIEHRELEQKYGNQISGIEHQLVSLLDEMAVLRSYNLRLRKALGADIASSDSMIRSEITATEVSPSEPLSARPTRTSSERERETFVVSSLGTSGNESSGYSFVRSEQNNLSETQEFPFSMPTLGYLTRGMEGEQGHFGIDIASKEGNPVVSAANGNVIYSDWSYDFGFMMIIAHGRGYMTVYKHNKSLLKNVGSSVKRGELIALLGNTGRTSSGPHLHFEVWKDGVALDPEQYLVSVQ